jgi:hypothetical protein
MTPSRVTAEEHLRWCKEHALGYLDRGDAVGAVTAMCSGMRRHPGTANHAGLPLLVTLAAEGRLAGPGELRKFIEEFRRARCQRRRDRRVA